MNGLKTFACVTTGTTCVPVVLMENTLNIA
jgi:hypothetical protein